MPALLRTIRADITTLDVDAIVNAANSSLLGGGGVDGAIHEAAGRGLFEECRGLRRCPPGEARITGGHRLKARHVIHTVGPVWSGGSRNEPATLASCYERSLRLAMDNRVRSIAFPSISTGVYGYPVELAAPLAVRTIRGICAQNDALDEVIFCCFSDGHLKLYSSLLAN